MKDVTSRWHLFFINKKYLLSCCLVDLLTFLLSLHKLKFIKIMRVRHESDNPEFVVSAVVEAMQELKAKDVVSLD